MHPTRTCEHCGGFLLAERNVDTHERELVCVACGRGVGPRPALPEAELGAEGQRLRVRTPRTPVARGGRS